MTTAFITIGIPASGKTTWAREASKGNTNSVIVSRDDIRNSFGWKSGFDEQRVTRIHRAQMEAAFLEGMDVYVADTNINPKFRRQLIKFCHEHGVDVQTVVFPISLDEAILRDSKRTSHMVGADVVSKFYSDLQGQNISENGEFLPAPVFSDYKHDEDKPFCVVVDLDGTVARHWNRGPFDESKVYDDKPIDDVVDIVFALSKEFPIVFASGRTDSCREDTLRWIDREFGSFMRDRYELHMRKTGDQRPDYLIKADIYDEHIIPRFNILMSFDDRDQVVRHVRNRGITVAQVALGRF